MGGPSKHSLKTSPCGCVISKIWLGIPHCTSMRLYTPQGQGLRLLFDLMLTLPHLGIGHSEHLGVEGTTHSQIVALQNGGLLVKVHRHGTEPSFERNDPPPALCGKPLLGEEAELGNI